MATVKDEPSPGFEDDVELTPSPPDTSSVKAEVGLDQDDVDEDSLDLNTTNADAKVWLVRLPKFLMEKWKDVSSTSGNDLGKVRIKNGGAEPWQVKLVLNESPENDNIPHEYDIKLVKKVVDNTYVFTEKDLPNYKKRAAMAESGLLSEAAASTSESTPALPPSGFKGRSSFVDRTRNNSDNTRFVPYVKTIPKQTALVGTACHECLVMPSLNDKNYSKVVNQRKAMEHATDRAKVTFLQEIPGVTTASFSSNLRGSSMFMRAQKKDAAKSAEGKATRIPQNELLDLLFRLFEEYDYWSMKGLRERTKQPESYLKEVLDTMAVLNKKGPYAMKYSLKPEFKQIKGSGDSLSEYMSKNKDQNNLNNITAEDQKESNEEEEDDDDDVEMETVI